MKGALGEVLPRAGSIVLLLLAWEGGARLAASRLAPPASAVVAAAWAATRTGELPANLMATLVRVACAFGLAMLLGTALGTAMGRSPRLDRLLDAPLTVLLNVPALVLIALAYVWFGLGEGPAIAAVALAKLPNTAVAVREGARALDPQLREMARLFAVPPLAALRHVVLPQLAPYLLGAARSGLAIIWKVVLVAELLGRSDGVGFQVQVRFQTFDVAGILAYTLAFALVVQAIEWGALQPLERRVARWR